MAAGAQAASLNLGGQWLFVGPGDWSVQLAHPTHRTEAVLGLRLPPGSMATSANSERMLKLCDGELGHLLDPRTGIPSSKTHSVSVWARSALVADALSTALFIDPSRAAEFAQRFDAEVILLRVTGTGLTASITPGLVKGSDPLTPNLRIIPLVYQQAH
jgi:thiamine biosynthesis lipoprotein